MKQTSVRTVRAAASLISLLVVAGSLFPGSVEAGVWSTIIASLKGEQGRTPTAFGGGNLQTMSLSKPATNIDPVAAHGGGDIIIVDDSALLPEEGPSGTIADIEKPKNGTISTYVVRSGDTLSGIAQLFGVSPNTILWANDIPRGSKLKIGQILTILPVTGVKYTVKKGDTLASVAKKFGGDATEIANFNGLEGALAIGEEIIIPDGEVVVAVSTPKSSSAPRSSGTQATAVGYYLRPLVGGVRTQGIHGYNGIDLAAPVGTPILASAAGEVIVAKEGGWNGGYGSYVVIQHDNGSQTLYSHESSVIVSVGQSVVQGQVIGYVGASGKATGPHVHFEIRNGVRNPF